MSDENGFLTDVDKRFLRGEKEYDSNQGRYDRRRAIAARARQAFHDFALLHETLDEHERNRIFDPPRDDVEDFMWAIVNTLGFLYHATEGDPKNQPAVRDRTFRYPFEQLLKMGVREGVRSRRGFGEGYTPQHFISVELQVDVERREPVDRESVVEELVETGGERLTDLELRAVLKQALLEMRMPDSEIHSRQGLRGLARHIEEYIEEESPNGQE